MNPNMIVMIIIPIILIIIFAIIVLPIFMIYIKAKSSAVDIKIVSIIGMRLRGINPKKVIEPYIQAKFGCVTVKLHDLEFHTLAGGNSYRVVTFMVKYKNEKGEQPEYKKVARLDLMNKDLKNMSVYEFDEME